MPEDGAFEESRLVQVTRQELAQGDRSQVGPGNHHQQELFDVFLESSCQEAGFHLLHTEVTRSRTTHIFLHLLTCFWALHGLSFSHFCWLDQQVCAGVVGGESVQAWEFGGCERKLADHFGEGSFTRSVPSDAGHSRGVSNKERIRVCTFLCQRS